MTRAALSRPLIGSLALALVAALVVWDAAAHGLPDPFRSPPALALGSGAAPTGAHCTGN
jgi:hypothetical protein